MKYTFDREILEKMIRVQPIVVQELRRLIEEDLNKCGIYYRLYARVKAPASLEKKYLNKNYNEDKLIQDLIGLRINVYFQEDLDICQMIMAKRFIQVDWSEEASSENKFNASKRNGVYKLPSYLTGRISEETWQFFIDQTFEIQYKTVLFEGWHEIEHDIRYKNKAIWANHSKYLRNLNSIIATLELCDNSITHVIEEMAYSLYKEYDWENMIRLHYRMKLKDNGLLPDLKEFLNHEENYFIGKALFKCDKQLVINELLNYNSAMQLDVNTLIAVVNEVSIQSDEIRHILEKNEIQLIRMTKKSLGYRGVKQCPLIANDIGHIKVVVDKRYFEDVCQIIQDWTVDKFGVVFAKLNSHVESCDYRDFGYSVRIQYDRKAFSYLLETSHMDEVTPKCFWVTKAHIWEENDKLWMEIKNIYYSETMLNSREKIMNFSIPGFYRTICRTIGAVDGMKLIAKYHVVDSVKHVQELETLIHKEDRQLPVIVIVNKNHQENMDDSAWLDKKWMEDLAWNVKNYAHVFVSGEDMLNTCRKEGIYLFDKENGSCEEYYSKKDVDACTYDYILGIGRNSENGDVTVCRNAFEHLVEDKIKEWNAR